MNRFKNRDDLAAKIEGEGGAFQALKYGIRVAHMPEGDDEMADRWRDMEMACGIFYLAVDRVDEMFPKQPKD